jgi:ribosome modulation factor
MNRDHELHEAAVLMRLHARTPAEEAYLRGYVSGAARRLAGGIGKDEPEAVAFGLLEDAPGGLVQVLGRGYRDGLAGESLKIQLPNQRSNHDEA